MSLRMDSMTDVSLRDRQYGGHVLEGWTVWRTCPWGMDSMTDSGPGSGWRTEGRRWPRDRMNGRHGPGGQTKWRTSDVTLTLTIQNQPIHSSHRALGQCCIVMTVYNPKEGSHLWSGYRKALISAKNCRCGLKPWSYYLHSKALITTPR